MANWRNIGLAVSEGLAGASGDQATADRAQKDIERNNAARQDYLKLQMTPLLQSIAADQQRLSALPPNSPEHDAVLNNMALTIGKVRSLHGDKTPADTPSRMALTVNALRRHMDLGGKTPEQLQAEQAAKVNKWQGQNTSQAQAYGNAALPYAQTQEGEKAAYQRQTEEQVAAERYRPQLKLFRLSNGDTKWLDASHPENIPNDAQPAAAGTENEYQKAEIQLRQAKQNLDEAKFKASQNPNSPATKAALLRAQGEYTRDQSYALRAQASAFGTYNGKPLPGALETPGGTPIGSSFASNYFKSSQSLSQLNDAQGAITATRDTLKALFDSGGSLNDPAVGAAMANPEWTVSKLLQGVAAGSLTPQQVDAVVALKSAQENIQGMRKAAGGGLSNEQVNRLEAQLPGPNTPDWSYAQKQLEYLDNTLQRLSKGVPSTVGGPAFSGNTVEGPVNKKLKTIAHGQTFTDGGKTYRIPSDKVEEFKREHPNAAPIQ